MKVEIVQSVKPRPPDLIWTKKKITSQGFKQALEDAIKKVK